MVKKNNENETTNNTENNNNEINNNTTNNSNSENKIIIILLLIIIIIMSIFILLLLTNRINLSPINNNNNSSNTVDENTQNNENNNKPENIYKIEYKEETKEYKNSSGKVVILNKRNYPIVTNQANQIAADKISKYLTDISNKDWQSVNNIDSNDEFVENYPYEVGVSYTYTTEESNKKYLSFKYVTSGGMGGVSWSGVNGYNFDYETGNLLGINNIMNYNSAQNNLYEYIISAIEKEHAPETLWHDNVAGYWKDIVKKDMFSEGSWLFTSSGIKVFFKKYSLGPGSTGVVEVEIPTQEINKYLYDKYKY